MLLCIPLLLFAQEALVVAPNFSVGVRFNGKRGPGLELAYRLTDQAQIFARASYQRSPLYLSFGLDTSRGRPMPTYGESFRSANQTLTISVGGRFFSKPGLHGLFIAPAVGFASSSGFTNEVLAALAREDFFKDEFSLESNYPGQYAGKSLILMSEAGYRLPVLRRRGYVELAAGAFVLLPNVINTDHFSTYTSLSLGINLPNLFAPQR